MKSYPVYVTGLQCSRCGKVTVVWEEPEGHYEGSCDFCGCDDDPCSATPLAAHQRVDRYGEPEGDVWFGHGYTETAWGLEGLYTPTASWFGNNRAAIRRLLLLDDYVRAMAGAEWAEDQRRIRA